MTAALPEHFFRHEYGRLVAMLTRRVGTRFIADVEDAAQSALVKALETWTSAGLPDNPSAWLYRVAFNFFLGEVRQQSSRRRILERGHDVDVELLEMDPAAGFGASIEDDLLRMLFACCDDALPLESRLAFALKILCGFDVREIALRLFTTEANVYKRIARARDRLKRHPLSVELSVEEYSTRLESVHAALYLLFTEGYLSTNVESAIRKELCDEAIRLATLLAQHRVGQVPESFALLALMHLHSARLASREDGVGGLILFEEQDRSLWNREQIAVGLQWLAESAHGERFTRYHAEAGIAAEHCIADSFQNTRWDRIVECYELLERTAASPIHRLNRAIAVAERDGAAAGLQLLDDVPPPEWLRSSYQWAAVRADLYRRSGNIDAARSCRDAALMLAPSPAIRKLLQKRLQI